MTKQSEIKLWEFSGRLGLKEHFSRNDKDYTDIPSNLTKRSKLEKLYKLKRPWYPPSGKYGALESYVDAAKFDIKDILSKRSCISDFNKDERATLEKLNPHTARWQAILRKAGFRSYRGMFSLHNWNWTLRLRSSSVLLTAYRDNSTFSQKSTRKARHVSVIWHSTKIISEFLDLRIRPHVEDWPSYLRHPWLH